jgi:hypothetical protein
VRSLNPRAQSAVGAAAAVDRGVLYGVHGPPRGAIVARRRRALEGARSGWLSTRSSGDYFPINFPPTMAVFRGPRLEYGEGIWIRG